MIVLDNMCTTTWVATTAVAGPRGGARRAGGGAALAFGALLDSAGSLSVEGVALEVVGAEVPVTATRGPSRAPRNLDFGETRRPRGTIDTRAARR